MLTLTGSSPLTISYTDGSASAFELDDPLLLAAVEAGDSTYTEAEDGVIFATMDWPADLKANLSGKHLSLEEVSARFCSFLVRAIQEAAKRILPETQTQS